jgi:ElaB/YqjD/DUF883 family membrane-anchored ribosome-binding protein
MNAVVDKDFDALTRELGQLRAQVAKLADRLGDTSESTQQVAQAARKAGKRAWTTAEDEADFLLQRVEENPIVSAAIAIGAVGLLLGLIFTRRR